MRAERLDLLAADVWAFIFGQLDAEPDWTGDDAGRVAAVVQRAFEAAVRAIDPEPARAGERPADGFCEFCGSGPECIVCGRGRP
jgi:hypothetical protein